MIEINLVPDVKQELIKAQRARNTVITISIIVSAISIAIVLLLVVYIFTAQNLRSSYYDGEITKYNKQFSSIEDLSKILTIQNQLNKINNLNNDKPIASRVFNMLVAIIPPPPNEIKISKIDIDIESSKVTVEGQAVNSYEALDVFRKTIANANVKFKDSDEKSQTVALANKISIDDNNYGEDATGQKVLRFTLTFNYTEELFALSSKDATVVIVGEENSTDSYKGVPKNIFADKAKSLEEEE